MDCDCYLKKLLSCALWKLVSSSVAIRKAVVKLPIRPIFVCSTGVHLLIKLYNGCNYIG